MSAQMPGTEFLTDPMKLVVSDAEAKIAAKKAAADEVDACLDTIGLKDVLLDNNIRVVASRAKEYDQSVPGARTYEMLFPQNTSDLINENPADEVVDVMKVVTRIQSLGESHPLFSFAAKLTECATDVDNAIKKHLDSITSLGNVEAQLQIAKAALVRQYLSNMFEAEKRLGKRIADRLFPKISIRSNGTDEEPEQNN
jgi:hypothetical protein